MKPLQVTLNATISFNRVPTIHTNFLSLSRTPYIVGGMKLAQVHGVVTLNRPVISNCKTLIQAGGIEIAEGSIILNGLYNA